MLSIRAIEDRRMSGGDNGEDIEKAERDAELVPLFAEGRGCRDEAEVEVEDSDESKISIDDITGVKPMEGDVAV